MVSSGLYSEGSDVDQQMLHQSRGYENTEVWVELASVTMLLRCETERSIQYNETAPVEVHRFYEPRDHGQV